MEQQEKSKGYYFFPQEFHYLDKKIDILSYPINSQVYAVAQMPQFMDENCSTGNKSRLKMEIILEIRQRLLVVRNKSCGNVIQVLETSFKNFLNVIQRKRKIINEKSTQKTDNTLIVTRKILKFTFKGYPNKQTLFFLRQQSNDQISRFIGNLQKLMLCEQNFHMKYKPTQKIHCSSVYSLFKAKDLISGQQVTIKAYRKEGIEKVIWNQCEFIKKISLMNGNTFLQNKGFFQTQNSIYIIFETYNYFLQNYCKRLSQKNKNDFAISQKKITKAVQIIIKIAETVEKLHEMGYSLGGIFPESIIVFKMINGQEEPLLNPLYENMFTGNTQNHQINLKQIVRNFQWQIKNIGIVPPQHFQTETWKYLQGKQYFDYLKISDIFGLGNIFHKLLFNKSVFKGENIQTLVRNNRNAKISLSQIDSIQQICPQITNILISMLKPLQKQRRNFSQLIKRLKVILQTYLQATKTNIDQIYSLNQINQIQVKQVKLKVMVEQAEQNRPLICEIININENEQQIEGIKPLKKIKTDSD